MTELEIKRGVTTVVTVPVDDTFIWRNTLMGETSLTFTLRTRDAVKLRAGDRIDYNGTAYSLYDEPEFTRSEGVYEHRISFYAPYYRLFHVLMKDEGAVSFPYSGEASDHLNLLLTNMQAVDPDFTLGTVEENGFQTIDYEQDHCYNALAKIAETFGLEWEVRGKVISLRKRVGQDTAYVFEYGKGKGLYSLNRQMLGDTAVVTRLYGLGGSQNIPASYIQETGSDRLIFPGRYLEKNTAVFGIREGIVEFEDIYPRLKDKTVLGVTVPADIPNAKTWTLRLDIPFDLAGEIIKDREPVVNFLSGELTGESFKIAAGSWKKETKELKIIVTDDNGYYLPRETRQPKVGDLFNLTEINMPQEYITAAQEELQAATADKLNQLCVPQYSHSLEINPRYARKNAMTIAAGDKVTVREAGSDALIRVQEVSYPIATPESLSLTLSDERLYTFDQKIDGEIEEVTDKANQNARQEAQKYSSRAYRDVMEVVNLLGEEVALIGDPDSIFLLAGVFFVVNKNNDSNSFYATKGQLQHDRYKDNAWNGRWVFENDFTAELAESDKPYYLYARCSKTENKAMFVVSLTAIGTEEVEGYYHFRVGVISSVFNEARSLTQSYGFTFIAGGSIKTGTILSVNGDTYFNLDAGEIGGKIVFSDRSTTENGTTLISGGMINTRLIDADRVVANAASIANFTIQENLLQGKGGHIIFQNEDIDTLSELISPKEGKTIDVSGSASATGTFVNTTVTDTVYSYVTSFQDFTVEYPGIIKFSIAAGRDDTLSPVEGGEASFSPVDGEPNDYKCEVLRKTSTNTYEVIDTFRPSGNGTIASPKYFDRNIYLPAAGDYRIRFVMESTDRIYWIKRPEGWEDNYPILTTKLSIAIAGQSSADRGHIYFAGSSALTKIGTNGLYSFWSLYNYLYFSQSEGFKVKGEIVLTSSNGEYSLTINNQGISISGPTGTNASNNVVDFTVAGTRVNIQTGEKLSVAFGKIARFFTDLKTVAFSGSYNDLSNKPTGLPPTGAAGGDLSGSYPNPAVKSIPDNVVTTSKVADHAITGVKLQSGLIIPGMPQVETPSDLSGPSQNVATLGNIHALKIGGSNYVTGIKNNWEGGIVNSNGTVSGNNYNLVTKGFQDISFLAGKVATASVNPDDVVTSAGERLKLSFRIAVYNAQYAFLSYHSGDANAPLSLSIPSAGAFCKVSVGVGMYGYVSGNFDKVRFKLELGDKATDYSLAPQDIARINGEYPDMRVGRATADGDGNKIPDTYAAKADLPKVYVDMIPPNPKDGDIVITTTG